MKNDYSKLKNLGFEDLNITTNIKYIITIFLFFKLITSACKSNIDVVLLF